MNELPDMLATAATGATRKPFGLIGVRALAGWLVIGLAVVLTGDLAAQTTRNYVADLHPTDQALAPTAKGRITLQLNESEESMRFAVTIYGVDRVVGSHFHRVRWETTPGGYQTQTDPSEGEGPIIAFFVNYKSEGVPGNGLVAEGMLKKEELIGEFSKRPFKDLIEHMDAGHFYATVHSIEKRQTRDFCCPVELRGFFHPAGAN